MPRSSKDATPRSVPGSPFVRLIHWNEEESADRLEKLRAAGYSARGGPLENSSMKEFREDPPLVVVIDLSRLPSHGREVANSLRQGKATRHIPIVFVGGEEDKVAHVRELLPDATYATWRGIKSALKKALAAPKAAAPRAPIVPKSRSGPDSGVPLVKKLAIRPASMLAVIGAPKDFMPKLGALPEGTRWRAGLASHTDMVLWFVKTRSDFDSKVDAMARAAQKSGLWVCWPKKTSPLSVDLSENDIRASLTERGLVDFKVCAIDHDWSGIRFAKKTS